MARKVSSHGAGLNPCLYSTARTPTLKTSCASGVSVTFPAISVFSIAQTMRKLFAVVALIVASAPFLYSAEPLDGRWRGETQGKTTITLDLAAKDTELTGTITRKGTLIKIEAGKIVGNTITFRAIIQDRPETFTAEFAKEEIRLWMDRLGRESAMILKRAKE